ncbi:hypothetical protein B0H21DRAFT_819923 [Amylocystis lapponica]|nr:hypothetical protein B0H21DRAFT_819923 [Amylocystis lapponica]
MGSDLSTLRVPSTSLRDHKVPEGSDMRCHKWPLTELVGQFQTERSTARKRLAGLPQTTKHSSEGEHTDSPPRKKKHVTFATTVRTANGHDGPIQDNKKQSSGNTSSEPLEPSSPFLCLTPSTIAARQAAFTVEIARERMGKVALVLGLNPDPKARVLLFSGNAHAQRLFNSAMSHMEKCFNPAAAVATSMVDKSSLLAHISAFEKAVARLAVAFDIDPAEYIDPEHCIQLGLAARPCKILALSNEILYAIIDLLQPDTVFMLSRVCSRFRGLALHEFFKRDVFTVTRPGHLFLSEKCICALPAWCTCEQSLHPAEPLEMSDTLHIHLSLNHSQTTEQLWTLVHLFCNVAVKPIHTITIYMYCDNAMPPSEFCALVAFVDSACDLGIKDLGVKGFNVEAIVTEVIRLASDIPPLNPSRPATLSSVEQITLAIPALFSKPFILSTLRTINSSVLRHLDLSMDAGTTPVWSLILPRVSVPLLESLSINGNVSVVGLFAFLSRHWNLTDLRIGPGSRAATYKSSSLVVPRMEHLWMLQGPARYVTPLLRRDPPSLQWLQIHHDGNSLPLDRFDSALGEIFTILQTHMLGMWAISIKLPARYAVASRTSFFSTGPLNGGRPEQNIHNVNYLSIC